MPQTNRPRITCAECGNRRLLASEIISGNSFVEHETMCDECCNDALDCIGEPEIVGETPGGMPIFDVDTEDC
jgi:hypothetical protein